MKYPPNYFQGILQLRNCKEEVIDFVENQIKKAGREDVYVSKKLNVVGGVDIYLTSNKFLRLLGKKLKKSFNGELKESEKLFSRNRQTQKNIYRLNVLFRLTNLKKGDIVEFRGRKVKIMSIGSKVQAKEVETGKRIILKLNELN
jgi:NMD protein affecting ribosome stability and mRNA decay